jgi:hypothetical protein
MQQHTLSLTVTPGSSAETPRLANAVATTVLNEVVVLSFGAIDPLTLSRLEQPTGQPVLLDAPTFAMGLRVFSDQFARHAQRPSGQGYFWLEGDREPDGRGQGKMMLAYRSSSASVGTPVQLAAVLEAQVQVPYVFRTTSGHPVATTQVARSAVSIDAIEDEGVLVPLRSKLEIEIEQDSDYVTVLAPGLGLFGTGKTRDEALRDLGASIILTWRELAATPIASLHPSAIAQSVKLNALLPSPG